MLVIVLSVVLLMSLSYNYKLHRRLKAYEQVWAQIEQVADHNQDGSFIINIQHLENVHAHVDNEAHLNVDPSGIHLMNVEELDSRTDDGPTRAA